MSRTEVFRSEDADDASSPMVECYIYKGIGCSKNHFEFSYNGAADSLESAYNSGNISGYRVVGYTCNFDRNNYSEFNMLGAIKEWCDDNGYDSSGVHLVIHNQDSNLSSVAQGGLAWNKFKSAHVKEKDAIASTRGSVIHECMHPHIAKDELPERLTSDGEHQLGKNYRKRISGHWITLESPMGAQCATNKGECSLTCTDGCSGNSCNDSWTEDLTSCTEEALMITER